MFRLGNKSIIIIIFSIIMVSIFGLSYIVFSDEKTTIISGSYEIETDNNLTEISIFNRAKGVDTTFDMLPENSTKIFEAEWNVTLITQKFADVSITITETIDQNVLFVYIDLKKSEFSSLKAEGQLSVLINSNFTYNLVSKSGAGCTTMDIQDVNFGVFYIETTTGEVEIILYNGSIGNSCIISTTTGSIWMFMDLLPITGDLVCTSNSGEIVLDTWDIYFPIKNSRVSLLSPKGSIYSLWAQHTKLNNHLNFTAVSSRGTRTRFWSPYDVAKFDMKVQAPKNEYITFNIVDEKFNLLEENHYQSKNHQDNTLDSYHIRTKCTISGVYCKVGFCFKARRRCGTHIDVKKEVPLSGSYIISTNDILSTVHIYNNTKFLNFGMSYLSDTTVISKIMEINWSLSYYTGENFGTGEIDVKISYKIELDEIYVDIKLNYRLDRIRPVFIKHNFKVAINPKYQFIIHT